MGKWVVLFFYPLDFTFVYPTELTQFRDCLSQFAKLNAVVLGCSVDSVYAHKKWLADEIGDLGYPLIGDITKKISQDFGVLIEDKGIATRGTFIIDPEGHIQYMGIHNLNVGRDANEIIRVLSGLQSGELCAAGWKPGQPHLKPKWKFCLNFRETVAASLWQNYPELRPHANLAEKILNIVTDNKIEIPKSVFSQAQKIIESFFNLRLSKVYQDSLFAKRPIIAHDPASFSVLMGYDFHLTEKQELKLIEINTNAASSLLVDTLYKAQELNGVSDFFHKSLKVSFEEEFRLCEKHTSRKVKCIAIIDENYKEQNSYFEFLMFKTLFERWGFTCVLGNPEDFEFNGKSLIYSPNKTEIDFVYNRLTDFYLTGPKSKALHDAYAAKKVGLSPNPHEYFLLADKSRLVELSKSTDPMWSCIPKTFSFREFTAIDELWQKRKQFFFKPTSAFGGRGAFKGESISRKLFTDLFDKDYVAQEYVAPPTHNDLKWDLRFYVYKNEIQLTAARFYKGQTTNFQTPGTGLGAVVFS